MSRRPDRSLRDDRRAALRDVMTEAVASAVMAAMRGDLDALRDALVDHAEAVENRNALGRRPDLRVLDGDSEPVVVRSAPGRIFASDADLIAAGIVTPRLRLVK